MTHLAQFQRGHIDGKSGGRPSELSSEDRKGYEEGRTRWLEKQRERDLRAWGRAKE